MQGSPARKADVRIRLPSQLRDRVTSGGLRAVRGSCLSYAHSIAAPVCPGTRVSSI